MTKRSKAQGVYFAYINLIIMFCDSILIGVQQFFAKCKVQIIIIFSKKKDKIEHCLSQKNLSKILNKRPSQGYNIDMIDSQTGSYIIKFLWVYYRYCLINMDLRNEWHFCLWRLKLQWMILERWSIWCKWFIFFYYCLLFEEGWTFR